MWAKMYNKDGIEGSSPLAGDLSGHQSITYGKSEIMSVTDHTSAHEDADLCGFILLDDTCCTLYPSAFEVKIEESLNPPVIELPSVFSIKIKLGEMCV